MNACDFNGIFLSGVVQHVEVPILTLNQCRSMKYRSSRITPNMVCAGKGKQDSCQVSFFMIVIQLCATKK